MPQSDEHHRLTVYYDGDCPLCRREIAFYKRRRGAGRIRWCDVSKVVSDDAAPGLSRSAAMTRFHVRTQDGAFVSGGDAFRALWRQLPTLRPAAMLFGVPGLRGLVNWSYELFLRYRPTLQRALVSKG